MADREDATDGHRNRAEAPEGDTEARNEAGEAGYTSVEGPKGAEFDAWRRLRTFRSAEEVGAHDRPTGGSNSAASGHAGGRTPVVGLFEQRSGGEPYQQQQPLRVLGAGSVVAASARDQRSIEGFEAVL